MGSVSGTKTVQVHLVHTAVVDTWSNLKHAHWRVQAISVHLWKCSRHKEALERALRALMTVSAQCVTRSNIANIDIQTLSITHHALSPPPHIMFILHRIIWLPVLCRPKHTQPCFLLSCNGLYSHLLHKCTTKLDLHSDNYIGIQWLACQHVCVHS